MTKKLEEGQAQLGALVASLSSDMSYWNEAETRFQFIDQLLVDCLGWDKSEIHPELHADSGFIDYVLGNPPVALWEAKRVGVHFDFPAESAKPVLQSISGIFAVSPSAEAAMRQAQRYCNDSGIEIAVCCNGPQLIAFLGQRIGQSWLDGRALVVRNLEQLKENFPLLWQCLSPAGVAEGKLRQILKHGSAASIPRKLSSYLMSFPKFRYKSEIQTNLRSIAELVLEDVVRSTAMKRRFYSDCYCDSGALSRDALVSKRVIEARYSALFPDADDAPRLEPAANEGDEIRLTTQIMTEVLARRPIVILGDVGVGKTSFLEDLMFVRAEREFTKALTLNIDLGHDATLTHDLREFVISSLARQLVQNYQVDIHEHSFVRAVYDLEIKRFRSSFKAKIYSSNKAKLDEELMNAIDQHVNDRAEHLRRSIEHVAKGRLRQVIIIIDNADQRSSEVQQEAFLIAQEFAANWNALVFIAVRPQTFFQSKRAGALSAYPHKVLTILPPRPEEVIEKRLVFALKVAEGQVPAETLKGVRLHMESMALFLKALLYSIRHNRDLGEILANITGGNIRAVVDFVTKFIGSPNVEAEKIIRIESEKGNYIIPIHEFSKAAILGDYSHFNPESSLAMNLFDVKSADEREHFLCPIIVAFLLSDLATKDRNGFVSTADVIGEMQKSNFLSIQTETALRRLTNKRLIETTERITFEEDVTGLVGEMPQGFRITSIGSYHLQRWAGTFAYLDAMVFDTPIFDSELAQSMAEKCESFDIGDRYERAVAFRGYLIAVWLRSRIVTPYFDWRSVASTGMGTFEQVRRVVERAPVRGQRGPSSGWRDRN